MDYVDSSELGVNDAGTSAKSDTRLTQGCSQPVRGWTYFLENGDRIRIGFSERPRHRVAHHRRQHPDLKILAIVPTSIAGEYETHQQFDHLRIGGEWFRSDPELLAFIERTKEAGAKIAAPPVAGQHRNTAAPSPIIAGLIAMRAKHGAETPIGHRCSLLAEQIQNMQKAETDDQRAYLKARIMQTRADLYQLSAFQ